MSRLTAEPLRAVRVALERVREPRVDTYAEFMSVGPMGAAVRQEPIRSTGMTFLMEPPHQRLRVTISTAERNTSLTIDEILTGRADSRSLVAQYRIGPFDDSSTRGLWGAVQKAPRAVGPGPAGAPIVWLNPTAFAWITPSDTLVLEQQADSLFKVTVHPRIG